MPSRLPSTSINSTATATRCSVASTLAAQKQAKQDFDAEADPALVLAGVGWHQGVIGVVAGRLAEKYAKPVIIISMDSSGQGHAVGSGRVGGTNVDLYSVISQCSERLVRFGGHKAAAGITIDERQVEAFRGDFCEAVAQQCSEQDLVPELTIDAEAPLSQLKFTHRQTNRNDGTVRPVQPSPRTVCSGSRIG